MDFLSDTIADGVRERRFTLGDVPGVLFSPPDDVRPAPLVLLAHGGGLHTVHPVVVSQARRYVGAHGLTVAALDAPGHGGRPRSARLEEAIAEMRAAMAAGSPSGAATAVNAEVAAAAVPEWRAVLDALMAHGHARPPVGFVGFSMGAAIGVPLLAAEPRIAAAVIGLIGHRGLAADAARIAVPVQLVVQWDDEIVAREDALALFAAIGSSHKSLHANPGGHAGVPAAQRQSGERFLAHHLTGAEATAVDHASGPAPGGRDGVQRLHRGVVLRVREELCEVLVEGRPTWARYARAFPSPRTERVAPGHLVALATAGDGTTVVVFRWYDAVVLGATDGRVQMWEPAHGQVLATAPHHHHRPGTRAYLSSGLPGADWWLAGPVTGTAEEADVELDEVERFCTEHGLWDQLT